MYAYIISILKKKGRIEFLLNLCCWEKSYIFCVFNEIKFHWKSYRAHIFLIELGTYLRWYLMYVCSKHCRKERSIGICYDYQCILCKGHTSVVALVSSKRILLKFFCLGPHIYLLLKKLNMRNKKLNCT